MNNNNINNNNMNNIMNNMNFSAPPIMNIGMNNMNQINMNNNNMIRFPMLFNSAQIRNNLNIEQIQSLNNTNFRINVVGSVGGVINKNK